MAPEQWENSASADIRADIYSLGCTLFFLLTGKPPYGEPDFETNRKKLMAHAVAPIPSLVENCADVPTELEEVYEEMMAKNPDGRFASPAEVAEAVAEFADAEELAEVIAALPPHDVCVATDNTGVQGAGADTPRRPDVRLGRIAAAPPLAESLGQPPEVSPPCDDRRRRRRNGCSLQLPGLERDAAARQIAPRRWITSSVWLDGSAEYFHFPRSAGCRVGLAARS